MKDEKKEEQSISVTGLDCIKICEELDESGVEVTINGLELIRADECFDITGLNSIRRIIESDLPPVSEFAVELLRLASLARELDHECRLSGSDKHRYCFAPVKPLSEIRHFEARHHIKLPTEYVQFLTQVGNGGAGPDNGLYSLEELEFFNFSVHSGRSVPYALIREQADYHTLPYHYENNPVMFDSGLTEDKWRVYNTELDRLRYEGRDEEYEKKHRELFNGTLKIVDSFDSAGFVLVCHGDMSGQIAEMTDEYSLPHFNGKSFQEWMLSYFKNVIRLLSKK